MKKGLLILSLFTFVLAHDVSKSFKVEGMHCGYGCVDRVKKVVTSIDGVKECNVDFSKSLMTVIYNDDKLDDNKIVTSLNENTTYETTLIGDDKKTFWSKIA